MTPCTILIPARNAEATIGRAVVSARAEGCARILVIDHASTDGTVAAARVAGGDTLDVVTAPADATLGQVRQIGLDGVATEFGMWLDADDEIEQGRAGRLIGRLLRERGDLAFDEADLYDGATGKRVRRLPIPEFLDGTGLVREFERNYLPAPGVPAFRTSSARAIGFDPALHGAEDVDFLLRAVMAHQRIILVHEAGYRQYASPGTLSRNSVNQESMLRTALRKHDPARVESLFVEAGSDPISAGWSIVSFLTLRGDLDAALQRLATLPSSSTRDFREGTLLAALGRHPDALAPLERAFRATREPEAANNLGVVLAALGRRDEAVARFEEALVAVPAYADAAANLAGSDPRLGSDPNPGSDPRRLTLLPLRRFSVRDDYR
jgi:tetratricopeptide (TPR) repeat protein